MTSPARETLTVAVALLTGQKDKKVLPHFPPKHCGESFKNMNEKVLTNDIDVKEDQIRTTNVILAKKKKMSSKHTESNPVIVMIENRTV